MMQYVEHDIHTTTISHQDTTNNTCLSAGGSKCEEEPVHEKKKQMNERIAVCCAVAKGSKFTFSSWPLAKSYIIIFITVMFNLLLVAVWESFCL